MFHLDPVMVLGEADPFRRTVREAAHQIAVRDAKRAASDNEGNG